MSDWSSPTPSGMIDRGLGAVYTREEICHNAQLDADAEGVPMEVFRYHGLWQYAAKGAVQTARAFGQPGYGEVAHTIYPRATRTAPTAQEPCP